MIGLAILASGQGTNLQVIIDACRRGHIQADIVGVIINVPDAPAIAIAQAAGLRVEVIDHRQYAERADFDAEMTRHLLAWQPDLIALAGFMRILTREFVQRFSGEIINIHPALLPTYKGQHTHQRVLDAGEQYHGCSVHFVVPELDSGAVIAQSVLPVLAHDTPETLRQRVLALEHQLYPRIIAWITAGRVALLGDKVYLDGYPCEEPVRFWQQG